MRVLLLIPSVVKSHPLRAAAHPLMDYHALQDALQAAGHQVELMDHATVDASLLGRGIRGLYGRDVALAALGFRRSPSCDAIFTNGENLAIPLAMMLKTLPQRPAHVTIGHRLSTGKKRAFLTRLRVHHQIDTIFVYASTQAQKAGELGIPVSRVHRIAFHADTRFYRPLPEIPLDPNQICAAGLEWRDYPTLIEAVTPMPDLRVRLAAASPWSKHRNETAKRALPSHIVPRRYEYPELRELYARSSFVVVPLYENDFQAGVTTLLEAMAMGKAVIVTRTTGQTDVVVDGENGLTVAPGDVNGWRVAITRLRSDARLRERLGRNARRWVEQHASLDRWVREITRALTRVPVPSQVPPAGARTETAR